MPRALTHLTRPTLVDPTVVDLGAGGSRTLQPDKDFVVLMPRTPMFTNKGFALNCNGARNVLILGGENYLPMPLYDRDPTFPRAVTGWPTMRITISSNAAGTWRVKPYQNQGIYTAPLSVDCTADDIRQGLIDAAAGAGRNVGNIHVRQAAPRVFDVVPDLYSRALGRIQANTATALGGLTAGTVTITAIGQWYDSGFGGAIYDWKGTCHLEGAYIHGPGFLEGLNPHSKYEGSVFQIANSFINVENNRIHDEFQHLDGIQLFSGPSVFLMENCHIKTTLVALMLQPKTNAPYPATIGGWHVYNSLLEVYPNPFLGGTPNPNACFNNAAGHLTLGASGSMQFTNTWLKVVTSKTYASGPNAGQPVVHEPQNVAIPPGCMGGPTWDQYPPEPGNTFCDPTAGDCGITYPQTWE